MRINFQRLVKRLTKEELNVAARTSYAFWYVELHGQGCVSPELLERAALREARRHLVASNGDVAKSLERLQDVCHHRQVGGRGKGVRGKLRFCMKPLIIAATCLDYSRSTSWMCSAAVSRLTTMLAPLRKQTQPFQREPPPCEPRRNFENWYPSTYADKQ